MNRPRYNRTSLYGRKRAKKGPFWSPRATERIEVKPLPTAQRGCSYCKSVAIFEVTKTRILPSVTAVWFRLLCRSCSQEFSNLHEIELPPDPFGKPDPFSPSEAKRERV